MNEYFINELQEQEEDSDSYDDESVGYEIEFVRIVRLRLMTLMTLKLLLSVSQIPLKIPRSYYY